MALKLLFWTLALPAVAAALLAAVNWRAASREAAAEAAYPPIGEFVTIEGVRLHQRIDGRGPPVVLLHGAGGNLRDFDPLVADLARRYTVVRYDRPGLGWSGLPPGDRRLLSRAAPSPAEQARLLAAAYDRLGLGPAVIAGQSYAGTVALAWALNHPGSAAGLTMIAAVSNPWPGALNRLYPINASPLGSLAVVPAIAAFASDAQVATVLDTIFAPQQPPAGYDEMIGAGLSMRRWALRANARQVNALRPHVVDMAPRYGSLDLPVEIVHGTADTIVPLDIHSEPLSRQIPGAALTRLDGIGHMPQHSARAAVADAIDRTASRAGLRSDAGAGNVDR